LDVGDFQANWSLRIDALTAVMLIVVTWVSAAVHIYSIGYMHHDPHIPRFMAYLSLFTFFMLMLVTSNNLIQLFLGWEGVGLCSYLLIGFWYHKESANAAAFKAFVVNRVGDFGFALGIFATFMLFDSVQFDYIFATAASKAGDTMEFLGVEYNSITLICLLLFVGAMGKSAQLGLHTWLPDAMEGPTPVSALIHAATMVTAGVFLVARCSPLFELSPLALQVVTVVGGSTAIFAATIAITQNDIKRVIAYSTCSQLGYMFFACGVSAYSAGVFHLMTHGFFKALLFLGAGSVIHAMSEEQDMRKMGGIWKKIPFTYAMMLVGTVAIVGIPPLAGYYSKDMILESAYAAGHAGNWAGQYAFWMGILAATLTAFYSWRLIFMTFHGKARASDKVMERVHESPKVMTMPLLFLAFGAIFSGAIGYYGFDIVGEDLEFWGGAITTLSYDGENILSLAHHAPGWAKTAPLIVGTIGLFIAVLLYLLKTEIPEKIATIFKPIYLFLLNKWYFDEFYDAIFVRPAKRIGTMLWRIGDIILIDGLGPNGVASVARIFAAKVSRLQTGFVYHYAFVMLIGVVGIVGWFLYRGIQ
jgi:NADH-quinone oxidoreductase subunit L